MLLFLKTLITVVISHSCMLCLIIDHPLPLDSKLHEDRDDACCWLIIISLVLNTIGSIWQYLMSKQQIL